jgi:hypothetical protein
MREFELMGTLGCHLCEIAQALIMSDIERGQCEIYLVDIAEDDQLLDKYAVRIPVLVDVQSGKALDWPFDKQQLQQFLIGLIEEG